MVSPCSFFLGGEAGGGDPYRLDYPLLPLILDGTTHSAHTSTAATPHYHIEGGGQSLADDNNYVQSLQL